MVYMLVPYMYMYMYVLVGVFMKVNFFLWTHRHTDFSSSCIMVLIFLLQKYNVYMSTLAWSLLQEVSALLSVFTSSNHSSTKLALSNHQLHIQSPILCIEL